MYRTLFTHILHRSFNFGLVFILELVLVAHHQVGVWHAQLDNAGWKARRTAIKKIEIIRKKMIKLIKVMM